MNTKYSHDRIMKITGTAILTAVVVVLQLLGSFIHLGPFSISLVLVPIVIGAALYGWIAGAWLGLVFSIVVLLTDAGAFLAVSVPGTIITVVFKGYARRNLRGTRLYPFEEQEPVSRRDRRRDRLPGRQHRNFPAGLQDLLYGYDQRLGGFLRI